MINTSNSETNPLVSIIVPVYNVEAYLSRCIDSLIRQTYNNCEIILIDDGSTDTSANICDYYAKSHDNIRAIHQSNQGLSAARNRGIDAAKGSFFAFIDSDDYVDPDFISSLLTAIKHSGSKLAICSVANEDEQGKSLQLDYFQQLDNQIHTCHDCMQQSCSNSSMIVAWNKLYAAELWETLRYPEGAIHEDELVFHYILRQCSIVAFVKQPLYHYVHNKDSIMHKRYSAANLTRVTAYSTRMLVAFQLGYMDLISPLADLLITEYLLHIISMDYSQYLNKEKIIAVSKALIPIVSITWKYLSYKQRINLFIISRMPTTYLYVRHLFQHIHH